MEKAVFHIDNVCLINSDSDIDLSIIPGSFKRKMNDFDKASVFLLLKSFDPGVQKTVFSSRYGEISRLRSLIDQYSAFSEVSPIQFTGSVHNYPVACFNMIKQTSVPYDALSAGESSISAGLVKAVISEYNNVLFCYCDNKKGLNGFSCVVSKSRLSEKSIKCTFEFGSFDSGESEFETLKKFLFREVDIFKSNLCKIKRV